MLLKQLVSAVNVSSEFVAANDLMGRSRTAGVDGNVKQSKGFVISNSTFNWIFTAVMSLTGYAWLPGQPPYRRNEIIHLYRLSQVFLEARFQRPRVSVWAAVSRQRNGRHISALIHSPVYGSHV